jgi:hypothetical protein
VRTRSHAPRLRIAAGHGRDGGPNASAVEVAHRDDTVRCPWRDVQSVTGTPAAAQMQQMAGGSDVPGSFGGGLEASDEGLNNGGRVAVDVVVGEEAASARLPVQWSGGRIGRGFDL